MTPASNQVMLRLGSGPLIAPVLCRVMSMVLVRANCPLNRLDDAMLICDAIAAHASAHLSDGELSCTITTDGEGARLRVGGLSADGADRLVRDSVVPGVGNVLERVADELAIEPPLEGANDELVLRLNFG